MRHTRGHELLTTQYQPLSLFTYYKNRPINVIKLRERTIEKSRVGGDVAQSPISDSEKVLFKQQKSEGMC